MAASPSRFGSLNILDSQWRRSVWKHWLRSVLVSADVMDPLGDVPPKEGSAPHPPAAEPVTRSATASAPKPPGVPEEPGETEPASLEPWSPVLAVEEPHPAESANLPESKPREATTESSPRPMPAAAPSVAAALPSDPRRNEVRARFDALFDRLLALEDTIDALAKRFAMRVVSERRQDQRVLERLDSTSEILERQALAVEAVSATLQRVEQRVERLERSLLREGISRTSEAPAPRGFRESRMAPSSSIQESFEDLELALAGDDGATAPRALGLDGPEPWESSASPPTSIRGNLAEMSLPTVLAMLELERRTGLLKVCADDGTVISATLRDGAIVAARQRELEVDPVDAVREALRFVNGYFWFRQSGVEVVNGPPRSVGSVLLEATRRNDEALRSA